jgi:hypothetical protein
MTRVRDGRWFNRNGRVFADLMRYLDSKQEEVPVDVVDAPSRVPGLWNAVPSALKKRLHDAEPHARTAVRADPGHDGYADPLDGFAVGGIPGLICHEQAFQYLVEIERRRSEDAQRPFLLMLLECDDRELGRLFPIVCNCVRETDFVGWYRQGAVVGATLTQDGRRGNPDASAIVRNRIVKALQDGLPSALASQVRLRLYEVLGDQESRIA